MHAIIYIYKAISWVKSHTCTTTFNSQTMSQQWPLLRGQSRWKCDWALSELYSGCSKISKHNCWNISTVGAAVWGWALSCTTQHIFITVLDIYPKSSASASHPAYHCNMPCLSPHTFPDNAQGSLNNVGTTLPTVNLWFELLHDRTSGVYISLSDVCSLAHSGRQHLITSDNVTQKVVTILMISFQE
jgi:hypothetical protein